MRRLLASAALPLVLLASAAVAQTAAPPPAPQVAPLSQLVGEVNIPYQTFTLPNGLTTIVNTDRKAPVVGVTVYYRVGSKNESRGHTGFAHLFEHLMFGGSYNVDNFDIPLEGAGSDSTNGSTWYDRTNYVETVPEGALDLALFEESDRMGYLLGAVNQDKLDKQRGVVENEKRQDDNQPYGLVQYHTADALLPIGHPYRHTTIGSMADLDAATLDTVRNWFIDHYGPNNVVLALSGDIDLATAKAKVTQWFGAIPRGPAVKPVVAPPVTLTANKRETITDQVPVTRILRRVPQRLQIRLDCAQQTGTAGAILQVRSLPVQHSRKQRVYLFRPLLGPEQSGVQHHHFAPFRLIDRAFPQKQLLLRRIGQSGERTRCQVLLKRQVPELHLGGPADDDSAVHLLLLQKLPGAAEPITCAARYTLKRLVYSGPEILRVLTSDESGTMLPSLLRT